MYPSTCFIDKHHSLADVDCETLCTTPGSGFTFDTYTIISFFSCFCENDCCDLIKAETETRLEYQTISMSPGLLGGNRRVLVF